MGKEEIFAYWLDMAEYDLGTAEAMLAAGRYVYVAFMCQQSLEKLAKGLYSFFISDNVPRVHNLSYLVAKVKDALNLDVEDRLFEFLDHLSAYYIQGRYPTYREKISQSVGVTEAKGLLARTKEVFQWLKSLKTES